MMSMLKFLGLCMVLSIGMLMLLYGVVCSFFLMRRVVVSWVVVVLLFVLVMSI